MDLNFDLANVDAHTATIVRRTLAAVRAGAAIRDARLAAKLSQQALARRAKMGQPTISLFESGRLSAGRSGRARIAAALGRSEQELFPESGEDTK